MNAQISTDSLVSLTPGAVVSNLDFSNDGAWLAVTGKGSGDLRVGVLQTSDGVLKSSFFEDSERGEGVAFLSESNALVCAVKTSAGPTHLYVVSLDGTQCELIHDYEFANVRSVVRGCTGACIAVILADRVDVWDCQDWERVLELEVFDAGVEPGAAFSDGLLYVSGVEPGAVVVVDLEGLQRVRAIPVALEGGFGVTVSPNGQFVLCHTHSWSKVCLYDQQQDRFLTTNSLGFAVFDGRSPGAVVFSHDSRMLLRGANKVRGLSLPELDYVLVSGEDQQLHPEFTVSFWGAAAVDAPYAAFSFLRDGPPRISWFKYEYIEDPE